MAAELRLHKVDSERRATTGIECLDDILRGGFSPKRLYVPRISPNFLAQERRCLGDSFFRQEYQCSFEALEGLVYPELAGCAGAPPPKTLMEGKSVGGIDFGFNSPFAALWGVVDARDILWLTGERYCRGRPLSYHAAKLPDAESPLDEHNHAMDALRYLVMGLDGRRLARSVPPVKLEAAPPDDASTPAAANRPKAKPKPWLRYDNEELWTPFSF